MKLNRIMTGFKHVMFLVVLTFQWIRGDTKVSCVFMEKCILPCSYEGGTDVVIHWQKVSVGELSVHSFYHNQDQLANQDQHFRGRTSLFNDQISTGNASLLLRGVKGQDEGRYKCYTSTIKGNKESFINLEIDAPIRKVNIQQVGNRITCSSEGVYPEPELTWSTRPPSSITSNSTKIQQIEQQLYNISSSLILSDSDTDLTFSCTISTRSNRRKAALLKPTSQDGLNHETTISCNPSKTHLSDLVWRFNHSQIILTKTLTNTTVSEEWKHHVKKVSESGSLTLQDLSSDQEGTYTCELSDAEEMEITTSFVRIRKGNSKDVNVRVIIPILVAAAAAAAVVVVSLVVHFKKKKQTEQQENDTRGSKQSEQSVPLNLFNNQSTDEYQDSGNAAQS